MDEVLEIVNEIKKGNIKPIYFLFGEEAFFIDKIASYIGEKVLNEEEKGFNQMVLYGKDATIDEIVSHAKRFPMMAEKQVVIVKEAQHLSRTIENLHGYVENPQPTTVLVFCYKYKKLDKRKALYKSIKKNGVVFESKKLYENQVSDWLRKTLVSSGFTISHKAAIILVEYLGTDLGRINNELEKLKLAIPEKKEITPEDIVGSLHDRIAKVGAELIVKTLYQIEAEQYQESHKMIVKLHMLLRLAKERLIGVLVQ